MAVCSCYTNIYVVCIFCIVFATTTFLSLCRQLVCGNYSIHERFKIIYAGLRFFSLRRLSFVL